MITNLLQRIAGLKKRGGFTLVELLVVIAIIAILAGVALGPITNGIKQAKHNASMQQVRQIGQLIFTSATDNTIDGNKYPAGANAPAVANGLINAGYVSDPGIFVVTGQTGVSASTATTAPIIGTSNISYSFTCAATTSTGGVSSTTSDLIPLVYFNSAPSTGLTVTWGLGPKPASGLTSASPFGTDGIAVFYKGNNATYMKAGTGGTIGQVENFIPAANTDSTTYSIAQ